MCMDNRTVQDYTVLVNITHKIVQFAYKMCVCVFIRSQNKQLIFHYTTLKVIGFFNGDGVCLLRGTD